MHVHAARGSGRVETKGLTIGKVECVGVRRGAGDVVV